MSAPEFPLPPGFSNEELGQLFYRRIAPLDILTRMPEPGSETLTGRIIGDTLLSLNGHNITLRGHQLHVFNSLMFLGPGEKFAARHITKFDFHPTATEFARRGAFNFSVGALASKLAMAANEDVILATGSHSDRRYQVSSLFALHDERDPTDDRKEGLQHLYQQASSRICMPRRLVQTRAPGHLNPIEIDVVGDKAIKVAGRTLQLSIHETNLLSLLLLADGQPLSFDDIKKLGFHLNGVGKDAWLLAFKDAAHALSKKLAGGVDVDPLRLHYGTGFSYLYWARQLRFRAKSAATTTNGQLLADVCKVYLGSDKSEIPVLVPSRNRQSLRTEIAADATQVARAFAKGVLNLQEVIVLSLRTGEYYDFLKAQVLPTRDGPRSYDQMFGEIARLGGLSAAHVGTLLGFGPGTSSAYIQSQAVEKLNIFVAARPAGAHEDELPLAPIPRYGLEEVPAPYTRRPAGMGTAFFSKDPGSRLPEDATEGLPREKVPTQTRHRQEQPETWRPAVLTNQRFISRTERLTADDISAALGISREAVDQAIGRIDFGDLDTSNEELAYGGADLLTIREQLVGVPLGYFKILYSLSDDELTRVEEFLLRNKFETFDGYVSPGAADYVARHIHVARELREESSKQKTDKTVSPYGEIF